MDKNKVSKSKIAMFNSIMNNPKMSRVLDDAINAPIGSTKRAKAKAILSVIKKTNPNKVYLGKNDGQGGPLDYFNQFNPVGNGPLAPTTPAPATAPAINTGATSKLFSDAWSELKYVGGGIANWAMTPTTKTVVLPKTPDFKTQLNSLGSSQPSGVSDIAKTFTNGLYGSPVKIETADQAADMFAGKSGFSSNVQSNATPTSISSPYTPVTKPGQSGVSGSSGVSTDSNIMKNAVNYFSNSNLSTGAKTNTGSPIKKETTITNPDGSTKNTVTTETTQPSSNVKVSGSSSTSSTGTAPTSTGTSIDSSSTGALSMDDAKVMAKNYVANNTGNEFYAQDMMKLIYGKTLPELNAETAATLKDEYNLTELLAKKTALANAAPTAQQDMIDYTRGRDQFISKVNDLDEKAIARSASIDMTNPDNAKMIDSYRKYLAVLKGRQNQQYGDYINKSTTNLNNDINQIDTQYTNAVNQYNTAYSSASGLNTDTYNNTKKALIEMYNTLEAAPAKLATATKNAYQIAALKQAQIDNASGKAYYTDLPTYEKLMIDPNAANKGELYSDIDLTGVLNDAASQGKDVRAGLMTYVTGTKTALGNIDSTSDAGSLFSTADKSLEQLKGYADSLSQTNPAALTSLTPALKTSGASIISKAGEGVNSYVLGKYNDVNNAVKALDKASGNVDISTLTKNNSNVDPKLLAKIHNGYKNYVETLSANPEESRYSSSSVGTPTIQAQVKNYISNNPGATEQEAMANIIQNLVTEYDTQLYEANF